MKNVRSVYKIHSPEEWWQCFTNNWKYEVPAYLEVLLACAKHFLSVERPLPHWNGEGAGMEQVSEGGCLGKQRKTKALGCSFVAVMPDVCYVSCESSVQNKMFWLTYLNLLIFMHQGTI